MPPQRSTPALRSGGSSKPPKSERTHEENQERAYIAASRRSDRSLEARIESARRASEIHKRRTGRALRVTESDVVNEEMYEEEDDDVTHAYRNLSILMGGNPIDRRFAAYYQHQVHMRNIVDRAMQDSISRSATNATFAANQILPNSFLNSQQQQQQHQTQDSQQQSPQQYPYFVHSSPNNPIQATYRQHPYRLPVAGYRNLSLHMPNPQIPRLPTPQVLSGRQSQSPTPISPHTPETVQSAGPSPSPMPLQQSSVTYQTSPAVHQLMSPAISDMDTVSPLFPFTNKLPPESARFLAGQMLTSESGSSSQYGNLNIFDNTPYVPPKAYSTDLSPPHQQSSPIEQKNSEVISTPEIKWESSTDMPNNQEDGMPTSFFDDAENLTIPNDGLNANENHRFQFDHIGTDNPESWDQYMNSEWLDTPIG